MKPTNEQVLQWAREAGLWHYLPQGKEFGAESAESYLRHFFAAAYSAGAAAGRKAIAEMVSKCDPRATQKGIAAAIRALGDEE